MPGRRTGPSCFAVRREKALGMHLGRRPGGARDGAGPAAVPPPAPSWQLPLNLPFIACQKSLRGVFLPLKPFNPDFHHLPGCCLQSTPHSAS